MMGSTVNPAGMLQPSTLWGVHNNLAFIVQQALSKVQTATVVKVIACSNAGGVSPVGTVDVQILVNQISGQKVATPHVTMYGLPYLRIQGGANAVIIDPQPGDIGIAVFASRDITTVKSTKAQASPNTFRMHDFADGMYLGGLLNGTPTQYVQFGSGGVTIVSPDTITLTAPNIVLNGAVAQSGGNVTMAEDLTVGGDVVADLTGSTFDGIPFATHIHTGVTSGSANTGGPIA
jgi:phage baseplate assembly protein gpV